MKKYHKNQLGLQHQTHNVICDVCLRGASGLFRGAFVGGLVCNVFKVLSGSSLCLGYVSFGSL